MIKILSSTQFSPALISRSPGIVDGLELLDFTRLDPISSIAEYSGRICYNSQSKMGNSGFIPARLREGHESIIEHNRIVINFSGDDIPNAKDLVNLNYHFVSFGDDSVTISGNARAWRSSGRDRACFREAINAAAVISPDLFGDLDSMLPFRKSKFEIGIVTPERVKSVNGFETRYGGEARSTMIGYNILRDEDGSVNHDHSSATFVFSNMSRTCSHQLVRTRAASISQQSQRYVDARKGEFGVIVPPSISENSEAFNLYAGLWERSLDTYDQLRNMKIRQEDARFALLEGCSTMMVVTMSLRWWKSTFFNRLEKAAQWEIRGMFGGAKDTLSELVGCDFMEGK